MADMRVSPAGVSHAAKGIFPWVGGQLNYNLVEKAALIDNHTK